MAKGFKSPMGAGGGMGGMMQQIRKMQEQMEQAQEQLKVETVTEAAQGGAVKVTMTGDQKCTAIVIDPEFLKEMDAEMLQDVLLTAVNAALDRSRQLAEEKLGPLAGGMPGLGFLTMAGLPEPVQNLVTAFERLPGIGPKSASRLAFFLLRAPDELAETLGEALLALKSSTTFCEVCYNITRAGQETCEICGDSRRDPASVCVVEEPLDVLALERTGAYQGRYHVLHGVLSPVEGIGPDQIRIRPLLERLRAGGVTEVILATNPSMEGDATALYLRQQITPLGIRTTRLARGLPVGGDLEYADQNTLVRALSGRQEL